MITHDPIYKLDSAGKRRIWYIEQDGSKYRTVAGIDGGNLVTSGWTTCTGKQGRSDLQQAEFEINSAYEHKLTREYHRTIETVSNGAHFFKPMLAEKFTGHNFAIGVHVQPKLDGIRCIANRDGLWSRQGKPIIAVPHIHAALQPLFDHNPDAVIDGELYNHDLKDDFGEISSIVRKSKPSAADLEKAERVMQYHVYDMPSCSDTFGVRIALAHQVCSSAPGWIVPVPTFYVTDVEELDRLYGQFLAQGYEGQMVRLPGKYEQKRSKLLLKRKEFQDAEFEVEAIEEGNGNWAGVAKAVRCRLPDGRIFGAGIRGSRERAAELLNETHKVVTVRYFALTPDGIPRFPVVTKFHGAERTL